MTTPLTRKEVEAWPPLGPMSLDPARVAATIDALEAARRDLTQLRNDMQAVSTEDERGHALIDTDDGEDPDSSSADTLAERVERLLEQRASARAERNALKARLDLAAAANAKQASEANAMIRALTTRAEAAQAETTTLREQRDYERTARAHAEKERDQLAARVSVLRDALQALYDAAPETHPQPRVLWGSVCARARAALADPDTAATERDARLREEGKTYGRESERIAWTEELAVFDYHTSDEQTPKQAIDGFMRAVDDEGQAALQTTWRDALDEQEHDPRTEIGALLIAHDARVRAAALEEAAREACFKCQSPQLFPLDPSQHGRYHVPAEHLEKPIADRDHSPCEGTRILRLSHRPLYPDLCGTPLCPCCAVLATPPSNEERET